MDLVLDLLDAGIKSCVVNLPHLCFVEFAVAIRFLDTRS